MKYPYPAMGGRKAWLAEESIICGLAWTYGPARAAFNHALAEGYA